MGMLGAVVVVALSGCGVGPDETQAPALGTSESALKAIPFNIPVPSCRTVTILPDAQGTVRSAPSADMLGVAPVAAVQSMYFDTASLGPESRRGVAEFSVPALNGRIVEAKLAMTDQHGWVLQAVPPDWHTLDIYSGADNAVTPDDFARESLPFATFTTSMNALQPMVHSFDVTGNVAAGASTGFRVALQRTPVNVVQAGSAFVDFHLDLRVCDEGSLPNGSLSGRPGPAR
jgi:hypothetical protein